MSVTFKLVLIALTANVIYCANCPDGFESRHETCYFFSHGKESWIGAFESCKEFDAALVEVNDQTEDMYLQGKVLSMGGHWWIGLNDKLVEGEWVWETSRTILGPGSYSGWATGEPNNSGGGGENCVYYSPGNGQWVDTECYNVAHYICEKMHDGNEIVG